MNKIPREEYLRSQSMTSTDREYQVQDGEESVAGCLPQDYGDRMTWLDHAHRGPMEMQAYKCTRMNVACKGFRQRQAQRQLKGIGLLPVLVFLPPAQCPCTIMDGHFGLTRGCAKNSACM